MASIGGVIADGDVIIVYFDDQGMPRAFAIGQDVSETRAAADGYRAEWEKSSGQKASTTQEQSVSPDSAPASSRPAA